MARSGSRGSLLGSVTSAISSSADRKSTRLNSSHLVISYAVFCLKKKTVSLHSRTARGRLRGGMGENAWREALHLVRERDRCNLHRPKRAWVETRRRSHHLVTLLY